MINNNISFWKRMSAFVLSALITATCIGCSPKVNPSSSDTASGAVSGTDVDSNSDSTESTDDTSSDAGESAADSSNDDSGSTGNTSTASKNNGGTATTSKNNSNGGSSTFKEPIYDLKGRTITIAWENAVPKASENNIFNESIKLTEEKYNCKFKFVQKSDYQGLYQTLINDHASGTSTYDVIALRGYDVYPNAANSGAVLELSKYYDFDNDPSWNTGIFKTVGKFKNKQYGMPYSPNEMGHGIWYNRALFRKYNVTDPWTYVNQDKWNWDTFRAVCKQLTNDTNGDGKPDDWAYTSEDPWLAFVSTNNASLLTTTASGAPKFSLNSANALNAIDFVKKLHADNTVPDGKELGAITSSPFNAMTTGHVAMFNYHARYGAVLLNYGIASSDIGWVYLPKGPAAKSYTTSTGTMPEMSVIPTAAKSPKELVAAVQDLAAYWDTSRKVQRKVTDKTDELYTALKTSLDSNAKKVLYYQAENSVFNYAASYNVGTILQNELWPAILGGKSAKQAVDTYASKIQKQITSVYNGTLVN